MNQITEIIIITQEMIDEANKLIKKVKVNRTITSNNDTLTGILGEFIFAQWYYGNWKKNKVGLNKGLSDFEDTEIKTSAFPFNKNLNLIVREDYAKKRKPPFYVQIIIDINSRESDITNGTKTYLCGWATSNEIDNAPKKDFGSKLSKNGGYESHYIPILNLHPMSEYLKLHQIPNNYILFD